MIDLSEKVALVSGGARGMGASHVRALVESGAKVIFGDILEADGFKLEEELNLAAKFTNLDVTNENSWKEAVNKAVDLFGGLHILINNAGVACNSPIETCTLKEYRRVIDINQTGVFLGMREVIPAMRKTGEGSIINISSIDGIIGMPNILPYVASKFAVTGMTKTAALELAKYNIRTNSIHPGYIETPMIGGFGEEAQDKIDDGINMIRKYCANRVPSGRIGNSNDITNLVLFLSSEASSYCNGSQFVCDGGLTAGEVIPEMIDEFYKDD